MCVHANFTLSFVWLCMHLACSSLTLAAGSAAAPRFSSIMYQWGFLCTATSTLSRWDAIN
jgi:hypothetical protein